MAVWMALFEAAGFTGIAATVIVAEARLVTGQRPGPAPSHEEGPWPLLQVRR
jgi:hypothetical protein